MKGEFSRLSFDARKHYSGVLQQQGRVGLDADWNEWVEIVLRRFAIQTIDVIGKCGRPKHHPGFGVSVSGSGTSSPSVKLSAGRMYAGGLLAEVEEEIDFSQQLDWPFPVESVWSTLFGSAPYPGLDFTLLDSSGHQRDLFYAEVWQRHVTALNDEAERDQAFSDAGGSPDWVVLPEVGDLVRERALGGPDTCTRLQTVAQVKRWTTDASVNDCKSACKALAAARPAGTTGTLQVNVPPIAPVTKPCEEPLTGGYGGADNRTYRIEIHEPGPAGTATFKWSNENGAFAVRVADATPLTSIPASTDILVQSIGNDQTIQLKQNDWVEMCGEETELGVWRNPLAQVVNDPVAQPDGTWKVKLTQAVMVPHAPFLRRWSADVQTVALGSAFDLDAGSGLSISFFVDATGATSGTTYFHEQDYWIWSARTVTRDIEPEHLTHTPQPPRGIERHYCCLALVTWQKDANGNFSAPSIDECPDDFPPLTELPEGGGCCCCAITVGDGVQSQGMYNDLATAFSHLPDTAKLPGGVEICILPGTYRLKGPIEIAQSNVIVHGCGTRSQITGPDGVFVVSGKTQVVISGLSLAAQKVPAIVAKSIEQLKILDNEIAIPAGPETYAVSVQGAEIEIRGNSIRGGERGGGGIEVRGDSQTIRIKGNDIRDGLLRGITLGSITTKSVNHGVALVSTSDGPLDEVEISHNTIVGMGMEGIGVPGSFDLTQTADLIPTRHLRITDNQIETCCNSTDESVTIRGAISLADTEYTEILWNRIENNGANQSMGGVFILLGVGVQIRNNTVSRNGNGSKSSKQIKAGLTIRLAIPPVATDESNLGSSDGWAAVSICDNLVLAQLMPAVYVLGLGPMRVTGNNLTSQGMVATSPPAATVMILNYGTSGLFANFLGFSVKGTVVDVGNADTTTRQEPVDSLGGEVLFAGNRCFLDARATDATKAASIELMSLGDLSVSNNQSRCLTKGSTPPGGSAWLTADALLMAMTLRVEGNGFTETNSATGFSCFGYGLLTTGIGNQGTHCLVFLGTQGQAVGTNLVSPAFSGLCQQVGGIFTETGG